MTEQKKSYDSPALAPTISAPGQELDIQSRQKVKEAGSSFGCGSVVALCASMVATGVMGTLGYMYVKDQVPSHTKTADSATSAGGTGSPDATSTSTGSAETEAPLVIHSNQELKNALAANHVRATAGDFDFETDRPQLQAKAVVFVPLKDSADAAAERNYKWRPVTERVTRLNDKELLVAIKIINPLITASPYDVFVQEGLSFRARTQDADDPSIMYFYYHCEDKKDYEALLAQIGIKDFTNPKQLMWARSFHIHSCNKPQQ